MTYLFDTNIVLHFLKEDAVMRKVKAQFDPLSTDNETWLCVVSIGELRTMALANGWGGKKRNSLERVLAQFPVADIYAEEVLDRYAEVEAYSQCRSRYFPTTSQPPEHGKKRYLDCRRHLHS